MTTQKLILAGLLPALTLAGAAGAAEEPATSEEPAAVSAVSEEAAAENSEAMASFFATTTVTATGNEVDVFDISTPVAVIPRLEIERRMPENAVDLLRTEPGVDVNGVGPNQARPIIRGQRGLRVLFLEDGLRLNNPRRQTDFGEISGLVGVDQISTVEVVRGPASVLYGTDAIGGVLNLITRAPSGGLSGEIGGGYASAGDRSRLFASVDSRRDRFGFRLAGSVRDADDYESAAGSYGAIRLDRETPVVDSGVEDSNLYASVSYEPGDRRHQLSLRYSRYRADNSGFGFVEPEALGTMEPFRIRILYPFQDFDRFTLGWIGPGGAVADSVDAKLYHQSNERQLANDIDAELGSFGPGVPPSTLAADTLNYTDLDTLGARFELTRSLGNRHLLTYGGEFYEDDSFNTDFSRTTVTLNFPFPPFLVETVTTDDVANAPNASNRSYGLFVQDEIQAMERLSLTLGARYQNVATEAEATRGWDIAGLDFDDSSFVGSANLVYRISDVLNLVASYGTAFRAPNIIERLFNGPTPEGAGFQILNPDLVSEESDNFDLGLKYRRRNAIFEAIVFQTDVDQGIVQYFLSPAEIAALPAALQDAIRDSGVRFVVQQRNIDRLRYEGLELIAGWRSERGITVGGNYTYIDAERIDSDNPPTGDTVGDKLNAYVRWEPPAGRYWVEYRLRHNGDERANLDPGEPVPPVGETLPSFTVHSLSGGVTLFERGAQRHSLLVVVDNLTDELYAEFSNATFFRPEPKRSVSATYRIRFGS